MNDYHESSLLSPTDLFLSFVAHWFETILQTRLDRDQPAHSSADDSNSLHHHFGRKLIRTELRVANLQQRAEPENANTLY